MSNRRKPALRNDYRMGFLSSPAWFARRDRWFRHHTADGAVVICALCGVTGDRHSLELHHLDYRGVFKANGAWRSYEKDEDLIPLHHGCHEVLHQLIDRDTVLSRQRSRRDATDTALILLRIAIAEENAHA